MALPDKTPPTDKVLEYICVGCWSSFSIDVGEGGTEGQVVVCPTCGQAQPTVDEVLAMPGGASSTQELPTATPDAVPPDPEGPAPQGEAPAVVDGGEVVELGADVVVEEDPGIPVELALGDPTEPAGLDIPVSEEPADAPEPAATDDHRSAWELSNPDTVTWKMKTSGGITFNFHGIGALMSWAASKKNLGRATLTIEGRDEWTDYAEFSVLYRKLGDPIAALRMVGQKLTIAPTPVADIFAAGTFPNDPLPTLVGEPAGPPVDDAAAADADNERQAIADAAAMRAPRTGQGRPGPSARATADFTFITKVQPKGAGGRAAPFVLGFLLGAATVFVLWYVGVLNMLPIRPM